MPVPRVVFVGAGRSREVEPGTTLLAAIRRVSLPIGRSCEGAGICRACVVHVVEGAWLLTPLTAFERAAGATHQTRLACQARLLAPVSGALRAQHASTAGRPPRDTVSRDASEGSGRDGTPGVPAPHTSAAERDFDLTTDRNEDGSSAEERSASETLAIWSASFGPLPDP